MTSTPDGDLVPWDKPLPEFEEFDDAWVGCTTCGAQQKAVNGLDKLLWWKGHLYDHMRGRLP